MPHEDHTRDDPPSAGVSPEALRNGHEPLSTHTTALGLTMLIFFIAAGFMMWGLWALMGHYLAENKIEDAPTSAAPQVAVVPSSPLEPMPLHNDADWQDLVHLRNRENEQFFRMGWGMNQRTGEAEMPAAVASAIERRYGGASVEATQPGPLQFPPPMAPAPAGPQESLDWALYFPPTGGADAAYKENSIVLRAPPASEGGGAPNRPTTRRGW
ncbi:MAG TPA: hypothetical protein VHY37_10090 [Tepidisphaeraceae bacterium]|jgi:hypothetical protein|nr:hypothetical protein [Tepidisphaeraceae bacterium]